jgi:hypothetical protein
MERFDFLIQRYGKSEWLYGKTRSEVAGMQIIATIRLKP